MHMQIAHFLQEKVTVLFCFFVEDYLYWSRRRNKLC